MEEVRKLVVTKQYIRESQLWLESLKRGENISVLFFPKTDRIRRLHQLLADRPRLHTILGKDAYYLFHLLDFSFHNVEDYHDLQDYIAEQLNMTNLSEKPRSFAQWAKAFSNQHIRLVLVVAEAERYLEAGTNNMLGLLSQLVDEYNPFIRVMSFYETDFTHPVFLPKLPSTRLIQNIFYYPLYSEEDTRGFIRYLSRKWASDISEKKENEIVQLCGGHFWFVKESVREVAAGKDERGVAEGLRFRLETVYNLLLQSEREVIEKLVRGQSGFTQEQQHSLEYLQRMNVVDARSHCMIGLCKGYILGRRNTAVEFTSDSEHIYLNKVPVDTVFSRKEHRVVRLLLSHTGAIVGRDDIAKALWPVHTTEQYSDWAIDQIMARLRKRLTELSLSPTLLRAVRGKGYMLDSTKL